MIPPSKKVTVHDVTKRYGKVMALRGVSAEFLPGEVHAVLGENGAGKSTLMGILAGFFAPDSGTVTLTPGGPLPLGEPFSVRHLGVSMVHQHFMLVPEFTVEENLALAQLSSLTGLSSVSERSRRAFEIAKDLGWTFPRHAKVRGLPVGVQQRLEILKSLADNASVLIFDEPTAVLAADEVADLFRVLKQLRDEGRTIILIAHKLAEILYVADRVTILRRGELVASEPFGPSLPRNEDGARQLAQWMIGKETAQATLDRHIEPKSGPIVRVADASVLGDRGDAAIRSVTFEINRGEILGFGGVDGNGQLELAEALAGVRPLKTGSLEMPEAVYVPQDRQADGLALNMSIRENLFISAHARPAFAIGPFLKKLALRTWADSIRDRFGIKAASLDDPVSSLSGGNQQKVVVGRSLDENPSFLVVINPTRGLDFNATTFVHSQIRRVADAGAAVALFTTDHDELEALASRKIFLSSGSLHESLEESLVGGH